MLRTAVFLFIFTADILIEKKHFLEINGVILFYPIRPDYTGTSIEKVYSVRVVGCIDV